MAQLQSTNVVGTLCVNGVAVGGGKDFKFACFSGSTTWTPSSDLVDGGGNIEALLVGGGGGGGFAYRRSLCTQYAQLGSGGAGGGGEVSHKFINIDSTDACTVTIGAGGNSGSGCCENNVGFCFEPAEKGGNTTLGSSATAYGGGGGASVVTQMTTTNYDCTTLYGGPMGGIAGASKPSAFGYYNSCAYLRFTFPYGGGSSQATDNSNLIYGISKQGNSDATQIYVGTTTCAIVSSSADYAVDNLATSSVSKTFSGRGWGEEDHGRAGNISTCKFATGPRNAFGAGGDGSYAAGVNNTSCDFGKEGTGGVMVLKWAE